MRDSSIEGGWVEDVDTRFKLLFDLAPRCGWVDRWVSGRVIANEDVC